MQFQTSQPAWGDTERWLLATFGNLHATLEKAAAVRAGPDAALYSPEYLEGHVGAVTAYVPIAGEPDQISGADLIEVPAADLAVTTHSGSLDDIDQTYGALGSFVAERVLAADGPIRQNYFASTGDGDTPPAVRVEVCWPIPQISS